MRMRAYACTTRTRMQHAHHPLERVAPVPVKRPSSSRSHLAARRVMLTASEAAFDLDDLVDEDVASLDVVADLLGQPARSSTPIESTEQSGDKETLKPG